MSFSDSAAIKRPDKNIFDEMDGSFRLVFFLFVKTLKFKSSY